MRPYFAFFDRIRGFKKGLLAQLVEQWTLNPTVASSILARPTILERQMAQSRRIKRGAPFFRHLAVVMSRYARSLAATKQSVASALLVRCVVLPSSKTRQILSKGFNLFVRQSLGAGRHDIAQAGA